MNYTTYDLINGLDYKANNMNAYTPPEFFKEASQRLQDFYELAVKQREQLSFRNAADAEVLRFGDENDDSCDSIDRKSLLNQYCQMTCGCDYCDCGCSDDVVNLIKSQSKV